DGVNDAACCRWAPGAGMTDLRWCAHPTVAPMARSNSGVLLLLKARKNAATRQPAPQTLASPCQAGAQRPLAAPQVASGLLERLALPVAKHDGQAIFRRQAIHFLVQQRLRFGRIALVRLRARVPGEIGAVGQ